MRRLWLGAGLAGVLAFWAPPARGQDTGMQALDAAWVKAMKTNDVEAATACYAADAVMWFPDAPEARGAKAILHARAPVTGINRSPVRALVIARMRTGRSDTGASAPALNMTVVRCSLGV